MMKQLLYLAIFLLISSDAVLAADPKYTVLSDEFTVNYFWGVGNPLSSKRLVSCPEYHSDDIEKIKEEGDSKNIEIFNPKLTFTRHTYLMCFFKGICYTGHMIPVMSNIKEISCFIFLIGFACI